MRPGALMSKSRTDEFKAGIHNTGDSECLLGLDIPAAPAALQW